MTKSNEIKIGSHVKHTTLGAPVMVVEEVGKETLTCAWWDKKSGKFQTREFHRSTVEKADKPIEEVATAYRIELPPKAPLGQPIADRNEA